MSVPGSGERVSLLSFALAAPPLLACLVLHILWTGEPPSLFNLNHSDETPVLCQTARAKNSEGGIRAGRVALPAKMISGSHTRNNSIKEVINLVAV